MTRFKLTLTVLTATVTLAAIAATSAFATGSWHSHPRASTPSAYVSHPASRGI